MSEKRKENTVPRHLLLKVALGHVVMFMIFYLTGLWAISSM